MLAFVCTSTRVFMIGGTCWESIDATHRRRRLVDKINDEQNSRSTRSVAFCFLLSVIVTTCTTHKTKHQNQRAKSCTFADLSKLHPNIALAKSDTRLCSVTLSPGNNRARDQAYGGAYELPPSNAFNKPHPTFLQTGARLNVEGQRARKLPKCGKGIGVPSDEEMPTQGKGLTIRQPKTSGKRFKL